MANTGEPVNRLEIHDNEIALRIAKMHTGRFEMVGLTRSWHGLQAGTASLNLAGGHAGYGPAMPGSLTLPAPYAYRCPIRHCNGSCDCTCLGHACSPGKGEREGSEDVPTEEANGPALLPILRPEPAQEPCRADHTCQTDTPTTQGDEQRNSYAGSLRAILDFFSSY